jgi:hydrogenase maturation protease
MNEWEWRLLEDGPVVDSLPHPQGILRIGTRVKPCPPRRGCDAIDLLLAGRLAVIESIEQDYDGGFQLAVVFEDDPGRDMGLLRQPGHRFFYKPDEVEICGEPSILIAGIGNIFLGDDGFGVEVVRRLAGSELPAGVSVVDFGIRGLDLAYALAESPDVAILIDACPRGKAPGTLYVIEPDDVDATDVPPEIEAHAMNPTSVLRMARAFGGAPKRTILVGCEPATLGPDEGQLGLSETVAAVLDDAADMTRALVRTIRNGGWPAVGSAGPAGDRRGREST